MWGGVLTERFRIYIYIRFAGSLMWGLLGWPIISMMSIYINVFLYCYTMSFFLETRSNLSVPKYFSYVLTKPKKTLMLGGGSNWTISYIYIRFAGSLIWGLLGWPIISMMSIYINVFLYCYTMRFFLETRSNLSVPKYFSYVLTKPKKHWCWGGVLTERFRIYIYIYDLLAVSFEGCWGGTSSAWCLFI